MSLVTFKELEAKDVINVVDGKNLGNICDMSLEIGPGRILSITTKKAGGLFSFFKKESGIIIAWDQVVKIGDDVVIVNYLNGTSLVKE